MWRDPLLEQIEEAIGPARRRMGWFQRGWRMRKPGYAAHDSVLTTIFKSEKLLLRRGRVTWGAIAQANNLLFSNEGPDRRVSAPAAVICSDFADLGQDAEALADVARQVYALKENPSLDPEADAIGRVMAAEMDYPLAYPVPASIATRGRMFLSTIWVDRAQLPDGYLSTTIVPLLILPEKTPAVIMVPGKFWPDLSR